MKKSATKSQSPPKALTKAKPGASEAKPVKLLAGGNPQIAKAEGDPPCGAQKPRRSSYPCEYSPLGRRSRTPVFHMIWGLRTAVLTVKCSSYGFQSLAVYPPAVLSRLRISPLWLLRTYFSESSSQDHV